jgi:hypothetical protein
VQPRNEEAKPCNNTIDDQEHGQGNGARDALENTPLKKPTQQITPERGKKRNDKENGPIV